MSQNMLSSRRSAVNRLLLNPSLHLLWFKPHKPPDLHMRDKLLMRPLVDGGLLHAKILGDLLRC